MKKKGEFTEKEALEIGRESNGWYIVAYNDGSYDIMPATLLSAILECGRHPKTYGYKYIARCHDEIDESDLEYMEALYASKIEEEEEEEEE